MLKLKELRFSGIGRFVDKQIIQFADLGNIVQVDALNKNTGGSSGSGKSTVFNAHDYLLGLNDLPNTVLQSRLTKDGISVEGLYDWDGKEVEIQRSKSKGLSIRIEQDVFTGSSKLAEERLDEILGVPRHLLRPMVHKRQKEGGFFLQLTPKQIHEFLTDCLGLSDLRKKAEIVDDKLRKLSGDKTLAESALESAKSGLTATQGAISALGSAPVKDIHQEVILDLKKKLDTAVSDLEALKLQHQLEREALENLKPKVSAVPFDSSTRQAFELELPEVRKRTESLVLAEMDRKARVVKHLSDLSLTKVKLENDIREGQKAQAEVSTLANEIKKIRDSICPTCEQGWLTETAKTRENDLLARVIKLKEIIILGKKAEEEVAKIKLEVEAFTPQLEPQVDPELAVLRARQSELTAKISEEQDKERKHLASENERAKTLLGAFATEQAQQAQKHAFEVQHASGQVDVTRRAFDAAVGKLRAYEEARVRYENSHNTLLAQQEQFNQKLSENLTYWQNLTQELTLLEEIKKALKSYASCSFDDALEYIGDVATRIIRHIPTMANSTIQLEGIRETKEGKVKEEVNAVISMDGEIDVPIKSLSGGERSSVDLAVDLAVVDLLENKTSKGIDVFILDEPFTGLDTVGIEMALEVLKNSNINKRLVIVEHNPEVKQMVESRLVVEREGQTSKIVQS